MKDNTPANDNDRDTSKCNLSGGSCNGKSNLTRRDFLARTMYGTAGAAILGSQLPLMAGPFENENEYLKTIPLDKKLDPRWLASLTARGEPTVYADPAALQHIGMPIGGLCSGNLYLGGDGKLWLWDIFNRIVEGIMPRQVSYKGNNIGTTGGANYISPAQPTSPLDQGFVLRVGEQVHPLDITGFADISFKGQYPIAEVTYRDQDCPLSVKLEAFSPFIPLNTDDSSLPATVMSYTVKNESTGIVTAEISGFLENAICLYHRDQAQGDRTNHIVKGKGFSLLNCSAEPLPEDKEPARPDVIFEDFEKDNYEGWTVFSDKPAESVKLTELHDFGTMTLALLDDDTDVMATASVTQIGLFQQPVAHAEKPIKEKLTGAVGQKLTLNPAQEKTITFLITWHFPNLSVAGMQDVGRYYASRFADAQAVARYVADNFERLSSTTRKWRHTWYDSTLPHWFLDRTMANTTTLATTTCYRFKDGRFWAWEGIGCCEGTCTHVWHYAQAPGRLFPEIERDTRQRVDFGIAFHDDGSIGHRATINQVWPVAHDGQCGRILGAYREHQMSADDAFLKRNWPKIKKAIAFMIKLDGNDDGIIEGSQPNTLDAAWFGKISFLASLYLATLHAGQAMANEMGDDAFAQRCKTVAERGSQSILQLYNGEYFYQIEDPNHLDDIGTGPGCYIDQVFGQSWAYQVGLGRLFDENKCKSALRALWKYNFVPDVGPFREKFKQGRWYAAAGDAGLLMCTWPKGGQNPNFEKHWQYMYFNECMTGFEWQVAAHMIAEGMLTEGLAVARAIHDRYHAALRNPYNEIECSDHYARAMAGYGAFITACGYEYHGPNGYLAFAPRLTPHDFQAAFTAARGWGTFTQKRPDNRQKESITVTWGTLKLRTLAFELTDNQKVSNVYLTAAGKQIHADYQVQKNKIIIKLHNDLIINPDESLTIEIT